MGLYHETVIQMSRAETRHVEVTFEQASWRHLASRVLHVITVSRPWIVFEKAVEPPLRRLHRRRCDDDCGTGRVTVKLVACDGDERGRCRPESHPEHFRVHQGGYCARMPFGAAVDCAVFLFTHRGRREIPRHQWPPRPRDRQEGPR